MTRARDVADRGFLLSPNRNFLINGAFDVWQRGYGPFSSNKYSADRWRQVEGGADTFVSERVYNLFSVTFDGYAPVNFLKVTATAGGGTLSYYEQRIEGARTLAGVEVTFSMWVLTDLDMDITPEFYQSFGSAGSSPITTTFDPVSVTAGTWQKVVATGTIPDCSGKTISAAGNDYIAIRLKFTPNTTYVVEMAVAQLEAGAAPTPFEIVTFAETLQLCQRYYEKSFNYNVVPVNGLAAMTYTGQVYLSNTDIDIPVKFKASKWQTPIITLYNSVNGSGGDWAVFNGGWNPLTGSTTNRLTQEGFSVRATGIGGLADYNAYNTEGHWVADGEVP